MGGTMIQEISPSIKNLVLLEKLNLENSRDLVNLPSSICKLKHLETLKSTKALTKDALPHVLCQLDPRASIQENNQSISGFYTTVMKDTATLAHQAVCELIKNGDAFLESFSSFIELSPYRPVGSFVFSTGNRLVFFISCFTLLSVATSMDFL